MVRSVAMLAVCLMAAPSMVQGYAKYVKLVPNGGNVPGKTNIGHLDAAGETGLSDFGTAFSTAGNSWTTALCQKDADGDGYTNGQELGDPCCTWTTSNTAGLVTDGISDPSDASKTPTGELKAGCSSSGTSTSTNSTGSGDIGDVVGTVAPAGPTTGGMPPDDDEDDSSESAVLTAGASMTTISSVAMGLATAVAIAIAL